MQISVAPEDGGIPLSAVVAILVAVIALVGVLIGQAIVLHNARAQRRGEQTKTVRDEVQVLMMVFFDFAEYARTTPEPRKLSDAADPYDEEWNRVAAPLAAVAANMAGRGRHRDRALELMDGLGLQYRAWPEGESLGQTPRAGYIQMAWAGFEIVAAWLRNERIPRHSRRVARKAKKMRARIETEYRARYLSETPGHKAGVLRRAWRKLQNGLRGLLRKWVVRPAKWVWNFLFAA